MSKTWTLRLVTVLCTLALGITGPPAVADAKFSNPELTTATEVGAAVQKALDEAITADLAGLTLEKATLTLETGRVTEEGWELKLIIFTISCKKKKQNTVTQTLVFDRFPKEAGKTKAEDLTDPLARAIASAASVAKEISTMTLKQVKIKIDFAVEKLAGGGIGFELLDIDPGGGGVDFSKTSKNGLELEFGAKS